MISSSIKFRIKKSLKHFFLIDDSPHKIAAGAALGVFLGIIPGEGVATTLIFATLFHLNRLAATAGVLATNMWMTLAVSPIAALVGGFLFDTDTGALIGNFKQNYHLGWKYFFSKVIFLDLVLPLAVGFIITAGIISLSFYFLVFYLLKNHKMRFK